MIAIRKSVPLVISAMVPQAVTAVAVLLAHRSPFSGLASVVSAMSVLASLAMVFAVGIMICALREVILARKQGGEGIDQLSRNYGYAFLFGFASIPVLAVVAFLLQLSGVADATIVWWMALTQIPLLIATPLSGVVNGFFQAIDRAGENLTASLIQGALTLTGALIAFVTPVGSQPLNAVIAYGAIQSLAALMVLTWRLRRIARLLRAGPRVTFQIDRGGMLDRVSAAIDAVTFVSIFLLVQVSASWVSTPTADEVAVAIAIVRTVVVPLKQVGITVARLEMSESLPSLSFKKRIATLVAAAGPFVLIGATFTVVYGIMTDESSTAIAIYTVVALQILVEPISGVLYSYSKVRIGPRAGLSGLLVVYLLVVPAGLVLLVGTHGSALAFWVLLLLARLFFAANNIRVLSRIR